MQGLCGHSFHNHICSMQQMWAPASDARPECDWKCRENFLCINLGLFSHTTSVCSTTTEVSNRTVIISYTVLLTFRSIILFCRYYLLNIKSVPQRLSIILFYNHSHNNDINQRQRYQRQDQRCQRPTCRFPDVITAHLVHATSECLSPIHHTRNSSLSK